MMDLDPHAGLVESLSGQVLPGSEGRQYPLRERIGDGGQGWVFRATWQGSVDVVVKVLRPDAASSEALLRFEREARVLRSLSQLPLPNPHIVRFYDHARVNVQVAATGRSWDLPFTVLEYVDGETLEHALAEAGACGLGLERARRILRHVVLALEDVHAHNVVHRDLKPSNILPRLTRAGGREIAKVTDFGLAKVLDPGIEATRQVAGATMGYAPPEQFENRNPRVGRQTDVFSLAAIFYETMTGQPAFPLPPNVHPLLFIVRVLNDAPPAFARAANRLPPELAARPDVVAAVDAELARAFAPDPLHRHATVTEMFERIEMALGTLGSTPSIPTRLAGGGIVVRPSEPHATSPSGVANQRASDLPPQPSLRAGATVPGQVLPRFGKPLVQADRLAWRCVTAALGPKAFRVIAAHPTGERAAGFGDGGSVQWLAGTWKLLQGPAGFDTTRVRAATWQSSRLFVAGAMSSVLALGDRLETFAIEAPGTAFNGIFVDADGIVLAGERIMTWGQGGMIAEIPFGRPPATAATSLTEVRECGPLLSVIRLGRTVLACGAVGALAAIDSAWQRQKVVHACLPALTALCPVNDNVAVAVGGGGSAFRVSVALDTELEPMQTRRGLFAVARGPDGSLWCAGDAGRVLRSGASGWARVGIGADGDGARVLAVTATVDRVLAFCDNGAVFEGSAG